MPSRPTDLFFPIVDNSLLIMVILMMKSYLILLIEFADFYVRNCIWTDNNGLEIWPFFIGSVTSLPFW